MLREPIATRRRRIAGNTAVAILVSTTAFVAWASQPSTASAQGASPQVRSDSPVHAIAVPPPLYPKEAAKAGIGGTVTLIVSVAVDGSASDVRVEKPSPDPRLDAMAVQQARTWRFTPKIKDGKPIASRVRVPVTFTPDEPKAKQAG